MSQQTRIDNEKRNLLSDLINATREVSSKYNGSKQLVTEEFTDIQNLLSLWERVLSHGLKTSIFNNVQELFNSSSNGSMFWTFAYQHLTSDEQKRFSNFKNVGLLCISRGQINLILIFFLFVIKTDNLVAVDGPRKNKGIDSKCIQ